MTKDKDRDDTTTKTKESGHKDCRIPSATVSAQRVRANLLYPTLRG